MEVTPQVTKQAMKLVNDGKLFVIGEYRNGHVHEFQAKGKTYRQAIHTVETNGATHSVSEWIADGVDISKWVAPFKRGEMVCVEVTDADRKTSKESGVLYKLPA